MSPQAVPETFDRYASDGRSTLSAQSRDIGRVVAGLLDGELERRVPPTNVGWAAHKLGCSQSVAKVMQRVVTDTELDLVAAWIGNCVDQATDVTDATGIDAMEWRPLVLAEDVLPVPESFRGLFAPGALFDTACAVQIEPFLTPGAATVTIVTASHEGHRAAANFLGRDLLGADYPAHPFRGRVLDVDRDGRDLSVEVVVPPGDHRDDLVLPPAIWQEIDTDICALLRNRERLAALGLGMNRGVLLYGPPGTGKTQLVRTIVAELAGQVTTLFVRPQAMKESLTQVYEFAGSLTPSIVVLEDVDLIVGARGNATNPALVDFLTSVDGLMTDHTGIITLATTNSPRDFDPAALRSARLDRLIEIPNPPPDGRRRIWGRYLHGFDTRFDLEALVRATAGGTGADIREVVRRAILATDGALTTEVLLQHAHATVATPTAHGNYL